VNNEPWGIKRQGVMNVISIEKMREKSDTNDANDKACLVVGLTDHLNKLFSLEHLKEILHQYFVPFE